jgi:hypothetical protein
MKNFFIVEAFESSLEYFYILDSIRKKHSLDIGIHAVVDHQNSDYRIDYSLIPIDSLIDINDFVFNNEDIIIAGSDRGLSVLCEKTQDKNVRSKKTDYLNLIPDPHKIPHFHVNLIENRGIDDACNFSDHYFPVIIKPVDGTGSKDVFSIYSRNELRAMLEYLLKKNNINEYIVQQKIVGQEFQLDFTSDGNQVGLIAIWSVTRGYRSYSWLENFNELDIEIQKSILSVMAILKKIDNLYGLYHVECIWNGEELKIIEINFRNHGHINHAAYKSCVGFSHIEADIISHIWPKFWTKTFGNQILERKKYLARVWIKNFRTRYIKFDKTEIQNTFKTVTKVYDRRDIDEKIVNPEEGFFTKNIAAVILESPDLNLIESEIDQLFSYAEERFML